MPTWAPKVPQSFPGTRISEQGIAGSVIDCRMGGPCVRPGRAGIPVASDGTVMSELAKPGIEVPEGDPPAELTVRDLVLGDGPEALPGRVVQVHYVGVTFASRREFDSSWERDQPFKFAVGGGKAIKGLDRGLRGMKVGGRREIIVPPRLGYGRQSPSPLIPAGSTLIFVVDLLTVVGGPAGAGSGRPGPTGSG